MNAFLGPLTLGVRAVAFVAWLVPALASAQAITEFTIPTGNSSPSTITGGPDGALWFTEFASAKIGRITTAGVFTEFTVPTASSQPNGIVTGPDGNLWFVESAANKVGRLTPAGVFTEFAIPTAGSAPEGITAGPDGNLWFVERTGSKIGRITTAGVITEFPLAANRFPTRITVGDPVVAEHRQLRWPEADRAGARAVTPRASDTGYQPESTHACGCCGPGYPRILLHANPTR